MARRTHRCPECSKPTIIRERREGVLERSAVTAAGYRPYRCRACGRRFYDRPIGPRRSPPLPFMSIPAEPLNHWHTPASVDILHHRAKRVLVVEDDGDVRDFLIDVLTDDGYDVFAVADGGPALTLLERTAVDLILLDIMLKSVHGLEVLARVWAEPTLAKVPVVVVSGLGAALAPALRRKVADVLSKPVNRPRLLESVRCATGGAML